MLGYVENEELRTICVAYFAASFWYFHAFIVHLVFVSSDVNFGMSVNRSWPVADPSQITITMECESRISCGLSNTDFMRVVKMTVFGLNIILTTLALLVVVGSSYGIFFIQQQSDNTNYEHDASSDPHTFLIRSSSFLMVLLLVASVITLMVGLLGCCGVANDNQTSLYIHAGAISALILFEVSCLTVLSWSEQTAPRRAELSVLNLIRTSSGDRSVPDWAVVHAVQKEFNCCGVLGFTDYTSVNVSIPVSCCRVDYPALSALARCNFTSLSLQQLDQHPLLQRRGCSAPIRRRLRATALFVYAMSGIVVLVQVLAFSLSCFVAASLRKSPTDESFDRYD